MAATTTTTTTTKTILSKVDPFILDDTIRNLDKLLGSTSSSSGLLLPLKASNTTDGSGSGNSNDDTSDDRRQYLETLFNKIDGGNKYRNPFVVKKQNNNEEDEEIFKLESSANEVWDAYRQLYYGHDNSICSVYFRRKEGTSGEGSSPSSGTTGTGGGLEAFFGIQKKCFTTTDDDNKNSSSANNGGEKGKDENEFARWESVHYITIQEPNYETNTCEYKINSTIWCRFQPEDVGDIPPLLKQKQKKAAAPVIKKVPPAAAKPKSPNFKGLDRARLEIFDKAKDNWDSRHTSKAAAEEEEKKKKIPAVPRTPINSSPIPAVVTSSSYHEEETIKVCKLICGSDTSNKNKTTKMIPIASHIHNIGTEIEKLESNYRKKLEMIHISKTCDILQGMYNTNGGGGSNGTSQTQTQTRPAGLHKHATGMGVGASLIGEIALKAKLKGLGNSSSSSNGNGDGGDNTNDNSSTVGTGTESKDITNKAMESILAAEKKKKLSQEDTVNAADTKINDWKSNLKKNTSNTNTAPLPTGTTTATTNDWKSGLKKTSTTAASSNATITTTTTNNENENTSTTTNVQASLKKTTKPSTATTTATKTATPEFLDFRSKLKKSSPITAATTTAATATTTPSSPPSK